MNYVLVKSFCALANRLNFTKAAGDLFITQPSLSRNIAMLENELGFQLFHRSKHAVSLTDLGMQFLPYAKAIEEANDRAIVFATSITKQAQSSFLKEVRIGVATMQFTKFLPAMISFMSIEMPGIRFSVTDGLQEEIFRLLKEDKLDLIFTDGNSLQDKKGLDTILIHRNRMKLVISANHPAARSRNPIPLSALPGYGLPLLTIDKTVHSKIKALFPTLQIKQLHSSTRTIALVEAGLGFSICQEGMQRIYPSTITFLELENNPFFMDATIAWNSDRCGLSWWDTFLHQLSVFVQSYTTTQEST